MNSSKRKKRTELVIFEGDKELIHYLMIKGKNQEFILLFLSELYSWVPNSRREEVFLTFRQINRHIESAKSRLGESLQVNSLVFQQLSYK